MKKIEVMKDFIAEYLMAQFSKAKSDEECLKILSTIKIMSPDKDEIMNIKQSMMDVFTKYCKAKNDDDANDILDENIILGDISKIK